MAFRGSSTAIPAYPSGKLLGAVTIKISLDILESSFFSQMKQIEPVSASSGDAIEMTLFSAPPWI